MPVDWAATGTWMQAWAGFAQAGAVAYVAKKGANAFAVWRQQKIGERRLDTAEKVLTFAYRLRWAFDVARSPMMSGDALAAAEEALSRTEWFAQIDPRVRRNTIYARAVHDRIGQFADLWDELFKLMPVAKALFGEQLDEPLRSLNMQRAKLITSANAYARDRGQDQSFTRSLERALWSEYASHGEENELDNAIAEAISTIERILQPELTSPAAR
jgi:hypothetical protein